MVRASEFWAEVFKYILANPDRGFCMRCPPVAHKPELYGKFP